jgi:Fur family peroxide stress response transcriptional regulator
MNYENIELFFYNKCKHNNLKVTPQRIAVYNQIKDMRTHPTIDMIYKKVKKKLPNITFDTVNRTVKIFDKIGILKNIPNCGSVKRYDTVTEEHYHFQCIQCGELFDFESEKLDIKSLLKKIPKTFEIFSKEIIITGLCNKCKKK